MNLPLILLAGGRSSRMGQPKGLLPFRSKKCFSCRYFIEEQVNRFFDVGGKVVVIVVGYHYLRYKKSLLVIRRRYPCKKIYVVYNNNFEFGQFSSVIKGLSFLYLKNKNYLGVFIHPIDVPLSNDSVRRIKHFYFLSAQEKKSICVIPRYRNRAGHPVLLNYFLIEKILFQSDIKLDRLDYFIKNNSLQKYISVFDSTVVLNLNKYEQYKNNFSNRQYF